MDFSDESGMMLQDILKMPLLIRATVLSGGNGLQRTVKAAELCLEGDLPQIKDRLIIIDGSSYTSDLSSLNRWLIQLNSGGAAGILIQGADKALAGASELLSVSEHLAFPIIATPPSELNAELVAEINIKIVEYQARVMKEIFSLHQLITDTMLHGGNLNEICGILYQCFGNSIAISSEFFSSFALCAMPEKYQGIYKILHEKKQNSGAPACIEDVIIQKERLNELACNRITIPICHHQVLYGHIYIWDDVKEVGPRELKELQAVTGLIALNMTEKISMLEMENNHKSSSYNKFTVLDVVGNRMKPTCCSTSHVG